MSLVADRFEQKVVRIPFHSCWEWAGAKSKLGYGVFKYEGKAVGAHRVSYLLNVGKIDSGLEVDHLCRNRGCVRPEHLEPVTKEVNIARYLEAGHYNSKKEQCSRGHLLSDDNLYSFSPGGIKRSRICKACRRHRYRMRNL